MIDGDDDALPPGIRVSKFDHSVENHFKLMDKFAVISGESESEFEQTEIQRLSSSVTFLRCIYEVVFLYECFFSLYWLFVHLMCDLFTL